MSSENINLNGEREESTLVKYSVPLWIKKDTLNNFIQEVNDYKILWYKGIDTGMCP